MRVRPIEPAAGQPLLEPPEKTLVPDMHPEGDLGLAAIAAEMTFPGQDAKEITNLAVCQVEHLASITTEGAFLFHRRVARGTAQGWALGDLMLAELLPRVTGYLRIEGPQGLEPGLERFGRWLLDEAVPAGGLGAIEPGDLAARHLLDSLLFAAPRHGDQPPTRILDLGTGVGLPGIPLALAFPGTEVIMIDRSTRRCRLAGRAVRVLGLANASVVRADVFSDELPRADLVVSRAAIPPPRLLPVLERLVTSVGVVGGSHRNKPVASGYETIEIPRGVLDREVWLLMMASSMNARKRTIQ